MNAGKNVSQEARKLAGILAFMAPDRPFPIACLENSKTLRSFLALEEGEPTIVALLTELRQAGLIGGSEEALDLCVIAEGEPNFSAAGYPETEEKAVSLLHEFFRPKTPMSEVLAPHVHRILANAKIEGNAEAIHLSTQLAVFECLGRGNFAEAQRLGEQAVTAATRLVAQQGDIHRSLLDACRGNLANACKWDRPEEAIAMLRESIEYRESIQEADHGETQALVSMLATILLDHKRYEEMVPWARRAVAAAEAADPPHPALATRLFNLADGLRMIGECEEAIPLFRRVVALEEQELGADHPEVGRDLHHLALALDDGGEYPEAIAVAQRAADIYAKWPNRSKNLELAGVLSLLAKRLGREHPDAPGLSRRALAIAELVGATEEELFIILQFYGAALAAHGDEAGAIVVLNRALAAAETSGREDWILGALNPMISPLGLLGRNVEAEFVQRRVLLLAEKIHGPESPEMGYALRQLGAILINLARPKEAESCWLVRSKSPRRTRRPILPPCRIGRNCCSWRGKRRGNRAGRKSSGGCSAGPSTRCAEFFRRVKATEARAGGEPAKPVKWSVMNQLKKMLTVAVLAGGSFFAPALLGAAEKVPLGIDCGGGESSEGLDLFKAEEAKDWPAAIKAARAMLSEQKCENAYLWTRLALFSARLGRAGDALEIGAYTLNRFPNQVGESLNEETDSFRELMALPGYAESKLKAALAARIAARDEKISGGKKLLAALPAAKRPPEAYVAKGACPFECCTFREWSVEAEVELLKAPAGAPLGRKLKVGDKVKGLTGEVHLRPRPMLIVHPFEAYRQNGDYDETIQIPAGGLIFELDSVGEGFFKLWYQGQIVEASGGGYLENRCLDFDGECWGLYLDPPGTPVVDVWWVQVQLGDGTKAWALSDGFGNMDGCG